jgi:hypothetical protein
MTVWNWETEHYDSVMEISVSILGIHKWEPDIYIGFSPALHLQWALQRTNTENWKQIFPAKELRGNSPNFHIFLYISTMIDLPILLEEICGLILGIHTVNKLLTYT